ncbi:Uncharacterised protein [Providencia stuartii]|nr:Uncharacterised protein [Providencia stuartii]
MEQYQDILNHSDLSDEDKIIKLRMLNNKIFTIERLSVIFGLSTGKISTLTSNKDSN